MSHSVRRAAWVFVACVLVHGVAFSAIQGTTSLHYPSTPSGKVDTRYHDGNDGSAAIPLAWAACPTVSVSTGATGSQNIRQLCLTEVGSPDATLSVSCTPTLAGGFSLTADGLSWSSTTAYSGLCQWTAVRSGVTVINTVLQRVEAIAPPSADTTAPPYPTGLAVTNNVGSATISWDSVVDNYESDGDAPSGTDHYEVCLDGANCQIVAAGVVSAKLLTSTDIGSPTGTSTVQSGNQWTIVSSGDIDGATDVLRFLNAQVSGDWTLSFKLNSVTVNGASFPKFGAIVRNTLVDGVREVACHNQLGTTSQVRARTTDGGSVGGVASSAEAVARFYRYSRAGNVLTCESSPDGNAFVGVGSPYSTTVFDTAPYTGLFVVGAAGVASTGVFQNVNLSTAGRVSYTYTTGSAGTITVRAIDVATNASAFSAGVAIAPSSPADVTAPTRSVQPSAPGPSAVTTSTITWDLGTCTDASGIRGYIPYTKTSSGGTRTTQAEAAVNSYTQTGLASNTTYYLDVKCVDNAGNQEATFSSEVSATTATSGGDPASAPTITSFEQNTDRSAGYTLVHSTVANTDHYNVQVADCADGQTPGVYSTHSTHTTASFNLTGFAISDAKSIKVGAANAAESVVFYSGATACKVIFDPWSTVFNFHPGWSLETGNKDDTSAKRTEHQGYINYPSSWTGIERSQTTLYMLEHAFGDYSAGVSFMDFYLGASATAGKYLWVELEDKTYGNTNGVFFGNYYPAYLNSSTYSGGVVLCASGGQSCSGSLSSMATTWDSDTADRYIAAGQWACATYGDNPRFEGLSWGGFSVSPTQIPGFNLSGYIAQVKRVLAAWRQACPKQQIGVRVDWFDSQATAHAFVKWARGYRLTISEYDTYDWKNRVGSVTPGTNTQNPAHGQQAFRGVQIIGGVGQPNTAGISGVDMRLKMGFFAHIEQPDITRAGSGQYGTQSFNEFADITGGNLKATQIAIQTHTEVTPTGFSPTGTRWLGSPGSDVARRCIELGTGTGCTVAIRDAAFISTRPTDWIQP